MSDQIPPHPITLDEVPHDFTFYGVRVANIGEDEQSIYAFTHDRRRAVAAARRLVREFHGETPDSIDPHEPKFVQIFNHCGCSPHDNHDDCDDCTHWGLPPCRDDFGWMSRWCKPGDENAIAVTELDWSC